MGTLQHAARVTALALGSAVILFTSLAASQGPVESRVARGTEVAATQSSSCTQYRDRIRWLEQQAHSQQREIRALRQEVDRLRGGEVEPAEMAEVTEEDVCRPPFAVDDRGIKRYHPECLSTASKAKTQ
jgi:hypothetical protein